LDYTAYRLVTYKIAFFSVAHSNLFGQYVGGLKSASRRRPAPQQRSICVFLCILSWKNILSVRKLGLRGLLLAFGLMVGGCALWSQGNTLTLLSNWDNNQLPINFNLVYNEVFGWAAPSGAEYAILGSHQRTYFIDVTNPATPIVRDSVEGTYPICIHRDFKTYQHYCYGVADEGNSTLQIIDMSYLPDSVHVVYNSAQYFERAHNVFIDTTRGRLYAVGTNTQNAGVIIFDLATNPANPILLASLNLGSYTHDLSVRNDTAYMNNGYDGLKVVDFTNPTMPVVLAAMPNYPQQGYNHSCWLTENGDYLAMCDETRNKSCKMVDVRNLGNVGVVSLFRSALLGPADSTSIPHNPLIVGNYVCVSYYHDGVQIWDISNPAAPQHAAGYDTWPNNVNYNDYYGAWGVYPFLPSGTVLGSDVHNGLFVFRVPFPFPRPITALVSTTASTCSNTANGSALVTPTGGTRPYTYVWSSGQTTPGIQAMLPGNYTVTISDRYGYNIVQTVTIPGPAPLLGNAQVAAESCPGTANGEIDLLPSGGTQPYNFHWSTGDLVEDLNGLTAGIYTVTITDAAGCVRIEAIPVSSLLPAPTAIAGPDTILCDDALLVQAQAPTQGSGHWQWVSGGGQIQNAAMPSTQLTGINSGSNALAWIVVDGQCSAVDTINIYVSSTASIDAGPDTVVCGLTFNLQGSNAGAGIGAWTVQPSAIISNTTDPQALVSGLQSGTYIFHWMVLDGSCQALDSCQVIVSQLPFAAFSYTLATFTASFANVSQNATAWHWDFGDGNTSTLQSPTHTYAGNGIYTVCLIAVDTCGNDTTCQSVNISIVGNAGALMPAVKLWPNPAQDMAWLQVQGDLVGDLMYTLSDAQGKLIATQTIPAVDGAIAVDLRACAAGIYFVTLRGDDWRWSSKVVKE
jgi:choice-of-anchor B domain-containing protein